MPNHEAIGRIIKEIHIGRFSDETRFFYSFFVQYRFNASIFSVGTYLIYLF